MRSDVDDVAGRDRMPLVAEPDDAASVQDQDAMVVRVVVERGAPARGDLEIAEREVRGALGGPDQDLLRDGGAGRRQVAFEGDAVPAERLAVSPMNDTHDAHDTTASPRRVLMSWYADAGGVSRNFYVRLP